MKLIAHSCCLKLCVITFEEMPQWYIQTQIKLYEHSTHFKVIIRSKDNHIASVHVLMLVLYICRYIQCTCMHAYASVHVLYVYSCIHVCVILVEHVCLVPHTNMQCHRAVVKNGLTDVAE